MFNAVKQPATIHPREVFLVGAVAIFHKPVGMVR
jgi:hypothetical protein